jgi:DNA-binding HxlR family transcriptional regulator
VPKSYGQTCPVAQSLAVVGDRWTLLIVRDLLPGPRRFADLLLSLPGISPAVLSARLKLLLGHGVVERVPAERGRRARYTLTAAGRELGIVTGALAAWGARYLGAEITPVHHACGTPVRVGYHCPACAGPVRGGDVRLRRLSPALPLAERAAGAEAARDE